MAALQVGSKRSLAGFDALSGVSHARRPEGSVDSIVRWVYFSSPRCWRLAWSSAGGWLMLSQLWWLHMLDALKGQRILREPEDKELHK